MSFFATLSEDGSYQLTQAGYTVIFLAIIALVLVSCFITKADQKLKLGTRKLVFSAMAIALAVVTSFIKLFHLPMGGSITLFSMLFVVLIGYWYGLRTGILAAVAYGLLQLIIDPYILTIPQMLTDYVFAFGALGLSGLFSNAKHGLVKGYIAGVLGRYFFAFLSGYIFFGAYAADYNMSAVAYSLVYNGIYIFTEAGITLILLAIPAVSKALARIRTAALQE
jgi:thiamine transporter